MSNLLRRGKFGSIAVVLQIIFIIVLGLLADYDPSAKPRREDQVTTGSHGGSVPVANPVNAAYPFFQDVHVMIFIGFGFLMTFLKRYGYSAVSFNLLIASFVIQWAIIIRGLLHSNSADGHKFTIGINEMLTADFAAATVLISFGAVLGKISPIQLLVMGFIEVVLSQVNEYIGLDLLKAEDVGESMYIHAFGAYFGLAVARVLYTEDIERTSSEGPVYHSDLFSMIGTVFLWMFWPSFNGGAASGDEQHRALVNTYLSLTACTVMTFVVSAVTNKDGKFQMEHIQNATLAGGVAVGTTANMPLNPWGALLFGSVAGVLSTIGFKCLSPFMAQKLKIHDTCGVNNLHGMPGLLAGIGGAVMAGLADYDKWGESLFEIFPAMSPKDNTTELAEYQMMIPTLESGLGRSGLNQGGYQMAAVIVTLLISIVGGALTGLLLKLPIWDNLSGADLFEDTCVFETASEGYPSGGMIVSKDNGTEIIDVNGQHKEEAARM